MPIISKTLRDIKKAAGKTETRVGSKNSVYLAGLLLFFLALINRLVFLHLADNNGTDAWARYLIARSWLEHPGNLPSEVWLPLHFWLLGAALWVWNSERSARLLTALLGAATVLPYWGMLRRMFDCRVAHWSALFFAVFGFHVGYSITTSSEAPTIFLIVLGIYGWVRFYLKDNLGWLVLCGISFSAASLCRVEAWFYLPVLAVTLLLPSEYAITRVSSNMWMRLAGFTLAASSGLVGWLVYSWLKWREPLHAVNRSAWLSAHLNIHQSLLDRLAAVPGALFVTLSPLILALALFGLLRIQYRAEPLVVVPAILAVILGGINFMLAVTKNSTMARYTLMYSWLLVPYAFYGLRVLSERWPWVENRKIFAGVLISFLLWQAGIIAGAYFGPPNIADKLSSVSPTLPLSVELRNLVRWLDIHRAPNDAVIFDDFNYEATDVIRYSHIPASEYFQAPYMVDPATMGPELRNFLVSRHPRFLVYSPSGLIKSIWSINNPSRILDDSTVGLTRQWQEGNWQVYRISYGGNP